MNGKNNESNKNLDGQIPTVELNVERNGELKKIVKTVQKRFPLLDDVKVVNVRFLNSIHVPQMVAAGELWLEYIK